MLEIIKNRHHHPNHWIALSIICLYVLFSVIWHFNTTAPWDDDCVVRYLNCREAFAKPTHFISLWNRPLSILTFSLPAQLGRHGILFMVVISALNGWFLFRICEKLHLKNAFLVIPFLLFQIFYFTISRNLLAEPLAAMLITSGFLCYLNKKWLLFAIIGGLLPLARLELSVLLSIWFGLLIWNRQWKYIPLLGLPCVIWSLAGTYFDGNAFWLFDQTFGKENDTNRYGHQSFGHYFHRYIYIIGPIVFYFFFIGFVESIVRKKVSLFLTVQFVITFMLYVVFSWKLNMGQAAGFLRHLATISPLAAVFALMGFNYWIGPFRKTAPIQEPTTELPKWEEIKKQIQIDAKSQGISNKALKHQLRTAKNEYEEGLALAKDQENQENKLRRTIKISRIRIVIYSITMLVLTYFFFSFNLLSSHKIGEETEWTNLIVIAILTSSFVALFISKARLDLRKETTAALILSVAAIALTLSKENPDAHNNPERQEFSQLCKIYDEHLSTETGCYVNHPWFFWEGNISRDSTKYKLITQQNLREAPLSSIVLWDSHYSRRLAGDVNLRSLDASPEFIELYRKKSSDNKFITAVFKKVEKRNIAQQLGEINKFISHVDDNAVSYYTRAKILSQGNRDFKAAKADCDRSVKMDSANASAVFLRGQIHFKLKDYDSAIKDYLKTLEIKDDFLLAYVNIGKSNAMKGNFKAAVENYSKATGIDKGADQVYLNRALAYIKLAEYDKALVDLQKVIELKSKNVDIAYYNAGVIMALQNQGKKARQYFEAAAQLGHADALEVLSRGG